jgi:hypothetical protein
VATLIGWRELFFILSSGGIWSVEYAPQLQLDKLQKHE